MLTLQQVAQAIRDGRISACLDGRDYGSLTKYFPVEEWALLGFAPINGTPVPAIRPWTREAILQELKDDNDFGFEKALNKRGISSALQYESVKMWLWILEDELEGFEDYAQYGLPLFKAVAVKYGFENPIGEDTGAEHTHSSDGDSP